APQRDPLAARREPIERCRRPLAGAGGIRQLDLRAFARSDELGDAAVEHAARLGGRDAAFVGAGAALGERGEVERGDRRLETRDLLAELLRALGRGRLQRERAEALAHLVLEVACAIDLDADTRELQLRAVPAALEAPETCRLLDQLAPLDGLRVEHR